MLLIDAAGLDARRQAVRGPLRGLYQSLVRELDPWLSREAYLPKEKALLSRTGGRCERDGASLEFDPASPEQHRCPVCGTMHRGEWHQRAWITWYQLWLAERCLHAALFHALGGEQRHATFARDVLRALARRYLQYPNRDNVLGPTRPFFSTYLESIWLLQVCIAASLLESTGDAATAQTVRDRIVEPSRALIASFNEGLSNRQVWNNAALIASSLLLGDTSGADAAAAGDHGLHAHLERGLLPDGTWYEGENYHQFAFRGLWYGIAMCEATGRVLRRTARDRVQLGFAAPFVTALPDFTMPARKDSQYGVSLRQWRYAELAELGFARRGDPALASALARCYEPGHERRDTGRSRSTADAERNAQSGALTRDDLGWRALLFAVPELPTLSATPPRSALLDGQGFAVFRRPDDVYVGFECGQSGGGHGHPDRLNVILSHGPVRWLDDLGTGSYVDPSLHWYRSTLAHNAPLVDGRSQPLADAVLLAHDEREGLGWAQAEFVVGDVELQRTIVVAPDYVLDEVSWRAPRAARVELPWHIDGRAAGVTFADARIDGGDGLEDGFSFLSETRLARVAPGVPLACRSERDGRSLSMTLISDREGTLARACAPGQPAASVHPFYVLGADAKTGRFRALLSWSQQSPSVAFADDAVTVQYASGERHVHARGTAGWHVDLFVGAARSSIDLAGRRARPSPSPVVSQSSSVELRRASPLRIELGEPHYRRSEESWGDAGHPSASVTVTANDDALTLVLDVRARDQRFAAADAENPFDNENADTMGAGLQLYVAAAGNRAAWVLVPETGRDTVRVRATAGSASHPEPRASWRRTDGGYEMRVVIGLDRALEIDLDLVINEAPTGRVRRRGQLVLSGGSGEFVYLRGDREDPVRALRLRLVP